VLRVRRLYGAHPAHLLLLVLSFVLAAYAVQQLGFASLWNPDVWWQSIAVWFVGAAVAHDLVLFPLYAAADRVVTTTTRGRSSARPARVPLVGFVRVPLLACALVTLLFFPGIVRQGGDSYTRATGQTQEPFLLRWVLLCAVFLLLGVLAYVVARMVAARRPPRVHEPEQTVAAGRPVKSDVAPARPGVRSPTPSATVARTSPVAVLVVLVLAAVVARRRRGI